MLKYLHFIFQPDQCLLAFVLQAAVAQVLGDGVDNEVLCVREFKLFSFFGHKYPTCAPWPDSIGKLMRELSKYMV